MVYLAGTCFVVAFYAESIYMLGGPPVYATIAKIFLALFVLGFIFSLRMKEDEGDSHIHVKRN